MSAKTFFTEAPWANLGRVALGLIIGVIGALVFAATGMPLPWLLGAIFFCLLASFFHVPVTGPTKATPVMRVILGVTVGGAFTSELVGRIGEIIGSLVFLAPSVVLTATAGLAYFRIIGKLDSATATYAAMPGAFQDMVALGREAGADERKLTLIHATRVLILVFTLPLLFQWWGGVQGGPSSGFQSITEQSPNELLVLVLCGVSGWWLAKKLHINGATIIGPMFVSGIVHVTDLSTIRPPLELINLAQLVIGCASGCKFAGVSAKEIANSVLSSLGFLVISLLIAVGFALLVGFVTDFSATAVLLAFVPGGQAEMILIAVAFGIDPAYVALHHLSRVVIVLFYAPLLHRWARRRF